MENRTEAAQFPEKEYINRIFLAVNAQHGLQQQESKNIQNTVKATAETQCSIMKMGKGRDYSSFRDNRNITDVNSSKDACKSRVASNITGREQ
jgi:hypothetical protein